MTELLTAFVTLFVIVDPPAIGPLFVGLTQGMSPADRRRIARDASLIALGVLSGAAVIGELLLDTLGIGLAAFRIAGGLLLFAIGFEMLFDRRRERKENDAAQTQEREAGLAVFPLAIPFMAGPGAITAAVLLSSSRPDWGDKGLLLVVIGLVIAISFVVFLIAPQFERVMGMRSQIVFSRLLGLLLSALAVQFVIDGVTQAVAGASGTSPV